MIQFIALVLILDNQNYPESGLIFILGALPRKIPPVWSAAAARNTEALIYGLHE